MVYEILATATFGKEKKGEVGIERLVDEGVYNAAFPLHDVSRYCFVIQFWCANNTSIAFDTISRIYLFINI